MKKAERIRQLENRVTWVEVNIDRLQMQLDKLCLSPHPRLSRCEREKGHTGKHLTNGEEWVEQRR